MSQGIDKNNIPDWLREMSGWEDTPEWLLSLIEQAEGPFSYEGLDVSMDELGFDASEVFSSRPRDKPKEPPAPEGAEAEAADWFSGLEEPREDEAAPAAPIEAADADAVQDEQVTAEADWLTGLDELPPIDESEETDWMADLDEGEPEEEEPVEPEEEEPVEPEEDLPDWMSGLGAGVPAETAERGELDAGGVPDWLSGLGTGAPADVSEGAAPTVMEGVPDWLSGLDAGAPTGVSADVSAEAPEEAAPVAGDEGALDWPSGPGADVSAGVPAEAPEEAAPVVPAVGDEGALDWLSDLGADVPADVSSASRGCACCGG
jgi:hypothetical protein